MKYYRSTITGKLLTGAAARNIEHVYGDGEIDKLIANGVLELVLEPSVEECLEFGNEAAAMTRYRDIHNCTLREAHDAIRKMRPLTKNGD